MSSQCFTYRQKRKLSAETELSERILFGVSEQLIIADQVCIHFYDTNTMWSCVCLETSTYMMK